MSRAKLLEQRRAMLVVECALQRLSLVQQTQSLGYISRVTSWAHTASHLVSHLKKLPPWVIALLAGLVVFIPGRAVSLVKNGLVGWQIWRACISSRE